MDDQQSSLPIPKFASFRPSAPNVKRIDSRRNDGSAPRERQGDRREPEIDGRSHQDASNIRSSRRVESGSVKPLQSSKDEAKPPLPRQHEDGFMLDGRGDEANLRYGRLHRYDVPLYHRSAFGSVLGLHRRQKILLDGNDIVISEIHSDGMARREMAVFSRLGTERELQVRADGNPLDLDGNADFVRLSDRADRGAALQTSRNPHFGAVSVEDPEINYRSIDGKAKAPTEPEDSDLHFDEELSYDQRGGGSKDPNSELRSIGAQLAKDVERRPSDGKAWLALIKHQDALASRRSGGGRMTTAERLSMADIKLSMYEKARKQVKNDHFTDVLILGLLEEGTKIWDASKLAAQWRTVLHDYPTHIDLWTRFLDFRQAAFASFRFHELREVFTECLHLTRRQETPSMAVSSENRLSDVQLYIILRYTLNLREGGFVEYSTAIWQALFEYHFNRPQLGNDDLDQVSTELFASFEEFWESEVPRIGEESAKGWAHFSKSGGDLPEPVVEQTLEDVDDLHVWMRNESQREVHHVLPARSMDEIGEDDPYRVVLMSDIKSILIDFSALADIEGLICAFLAFCHLPPPPNLRETNRHWWRDAFIRNDGFRSAGDSGPEPMVSHSSMLSEPTAAEPLSWNQILAMRANDMAFFPTTTESLFALRTNFWSSFPPGLYADAAAAAERLNWIRRILRSLVESGRSDDGFAEYYLAFEYHFFPATVEKAARIILKKAKTSARLYNAFALIQLRGGKADMADMTLAAAISMSNGQSLSSRRDSALLWHTWVWETLELHGRDKALARLLTFGDSGLDLSTSSADEASNLAANAPKLLQIQRDLTDGCDGALSHKDLSDLALYMDLLVLLTYLSSSIEAALATFESRIAMVPPYLESRDKLLELVHQSRARLLYFHVSHSRSFKPSLMRSTLADSISLFPENTLLLALYAWNEARFRIDDRVRAIIANIISKGPTQEDKTPALLPQRPSVIPHFFTLATELSRGTALGSNSHTIRSAFEQSVDSPGARNSAMLWQMYFLWELGHGETRRAKLVFYRAVRACPWVKGLYLLAFRHLMDEMSWQELRAIHEMMVEKELRLHVSLDDYFARVEESYEIGAKGRK